MRIDIKDIRPGDIVLFKGNGFLFTMLSFILSMLDKEWRLLKWKPWHVGFIAYQDNSEWMICESLAGGITVNPLSKYDPDKYRIYRWLDETPFIEHVKEYVKDHLGCPYDPLVYLWVIGVTLIDKIFHVNIGVWENESYMCWENVEEFLETMGQPICKKNKTVTISDISRCLGLQ